MKNLWSSSSHEDSFVLARILVAGLVGRGSGSTGAGRMDHRGLGMRDVDAGASGIGNHEPGCPVSKQIS